MKTLYFDCFSGISGDMTLGALVDIGVPTDYLIEELSKLQIDDEFSLTFETKQKMGITGIKAGVNLHNGEKHIHRNLQIISDIINNSGIKISAKKIAIKIFTKVAEAEAKVHGTTIDKVHFHEVGATDSIVDIVGAALCLDYLNVDKIISSTVEVGGGFVKCQHGLFPVPAPATTEILKGIPCSYGRVDSETTTPTGAAILAAMVDEFTTNPNLIVDKIAYGLGFKDFTIPNVLRVMIGETDQIKQTNILIESNLDDMYAEDFQIVMEKLITAGALDVYTTPITMKKARPGVKLSVLVTDFVKEACIEIIFKHTTTFGIRLLNVEKIELNREIKTVDTTYGKVQVKFEKQGDKIGKWKLEYEDLKLLAGKNDISIPDLRKKLIQQIGQLL